MQLKMQTDYVIRILLYLATVERVASTKEISEAMGIAETYCPKIIKPLMKAGYIASQPGKDGGYRLHQEISKISLFSIMELMEDTVRCNRCLEEDGFCSRNAVGNCQVHEVYKQYQMITEAYFKAHTIETLLKG